MGATIGTTQDDGKALKAALVAATILHLGALALRVPVGEVLREVAPRHEGIVLAPTPHLKPKPVEQLAVPQRFEPQVVKVPVPDAPEPILTRLVEPMPVVVPDAALVPIPDMPVPDPPPAADAAGPIEVGGRVQAPTRLFSPLPITPAAAVRLGIQGNVVLEAIIDREGRLIGLEAALAAVQRWTFAPASLDGQPVAVRWRLVVSFRSARR
jgi:outer membrane biosynthesis protein TonB